MREFKRSGLCLDEKEYDEVKKLKEKLEDLCLRFSKNINEEDTSFEFSGDELKGMPESWFNTHKSENNMYKVTLKYPDFIPIMKYVTNEDVRKKMFLAFYNRCEGNNVKVLEDIIKHRSVIAKKLGYKHHADYQTENRIMKNGENVTNFQNHMNNLFTDSYDNDMKTLTDFAKMCDFPLEKEKIDPWDRAIYSRLYTEKICNIDLKEVKKYFPLETVIDGMFVIYQKLLNLKFTEIDTDNKWHSEVKLFEVRDNGDTKDVLGHFYVDLHPRKGKFNHAAALSLITRSNYNGIMRTPVITIACNFPKNECLEFRDVVVLFHEFGHVMHFICCKTNISSLNAFEIEMYFIEAPSQMLEFWCYTPESLILMSKHTENQKALSDDIIEGLKIGKNILQGINYKRQLLFGLVDMVYHKMDLELDSEIDTTRLWYDMEEKLFGYYTENTHPQAGFGHLTDYSAAYYGYLRSETYAANMFYKKFKDGKVLDSEVGCEYRKKILEPGSSRDALELLKDFLGEEPDDKYFLLDKGY